MYTLSNSAVYISISNKFLEWDLEVPVLNGNMFTLPEIPLEQVLLFNSQIPNSTLLFVS
jgi:hypothetical protein